MSFRHLLFSLFHGGTKGKNLKTPKSVKCPASISENPVPLCEDSGFVVSELVVGSIDQLHKNQSIFEWLQIRKYYLFLNWDYLPDKKHDSQTLSHGNFRSRFHFDQVNGGSITLCGKFHFSITDGTITTNCSGLCHKCHTGIEFYKMWHKYDERWSFYKQRLLSHQQMFVEWHHMVRGMWRWVTMFSPIFPPIFLSCYWSKTCFCQLKREIISNIR